ncbi:MAG: hypothetical protein B7X59_06075 [Polaromonas sp. 39-63-203]|nr:MAG: hypothetical protein B7Y03_06940 [Polaromonas sp. 24-62-144]OZA98445.1 MAG: hypothetical protein B7X59_06075 [Polaromonas sp. 39-63-203]
MLPHSVVEDAAVQAPDEFDLLIRHAVFDIMQAAVVPEFPAIHRHEFAPDQPDVSLVQRRH